MLDSNIDKLARKVQLFDGLNNRQIRMILRLSNRRTFLPGGLLMGEGYPGRRMFVVLFGEVAVSRRNNGQDEVIAVLGPGATLGEMSLVDSDRRSARAVASSLTETLEVDEAVLASLPAPVIIALYRNMAAIISGRLRTSNEDSLSELLEESAVGSLVHALKLSTRGFGRKYAKLSQDGGLSVGGGLVRGFVRLLPLDRDTANSASTTTGLMVSSDETPAISLNAVKSALKARARTVLRDFLRD